jgi:hypothetical protein
MNSLTKKYKKTLLFCGALIFPYVYFMTIRPKLVEMEKRLENKITNISTNDVKNMKAKLDQNLKNKDSLQLSNKNI